MRIALVTALVVLAALTPGLAGAAPQAPAPAPAPAALVKAEALSAQWGRCPTARPAHRVLAQARRADAPRPRARRAAAALRSWTEVARVCSQPVAQPVVTP